MYLGIKGKVLVQKGDLEEAVSVLEAGLALPGVRAPARGVPPVPLADRSAIFVQVSGRGLLAGGWWCVCSVCLLPQRVSTPVPPRSVHSSAGAGLVAPSSSPLSHPCAQHALPALPRPPRTPRLPCPAG